MRWQPFWQLLLARIREPLREPEVIFWIFVFPVLLATGLGIAFRNKPPEKIPVAVVGGGARVEATAETLEADPRFSVKVLSEAEARSELRLGKIAIIVVAGEPHTYRYDPTRPDGSLARAQVDDALQRASGRADVFEAAEIAVSEPGGRYIDFLIPGLIGLNLLSGGMWAVGFVVVEMRGRNLLKRLIASPMRRSEFIAALMASRVVFMLLEVALLLLSGWLLFDIDVRGSIPATLLIALVGALSFAALGVLVASRTRKVETVSGLMNLVMLPMFVFSGVFFSSDRFPGAMQPFIQALPLTMLNDALRAVIIEGSSLVSQARELLGLAAWGAATFFLAARWFRWS